MMSRLAVALAPLVLFAPVLRAQNSKPAFAEDFESGSVNKSVWTEFLTGGNTLAVQKDHVAHGAYALQVKVPANEQRTYAFLIANKVPAALREHHFGRAYVYVAGKLPARHTIFLTAGTPGFPKYRYEEVATLNAKFQLTFVDQKDGGEDWHSGGPDVPLDRWFLLEWEFSDSPNRATVWVDGEKAYETPFTFRSQGSDKLVGGFEEFAIGMRLWGTAPNPFEITYDDVALDTKRIGPVK